MLDRACPARAEMAADRRDPIRARREHPDEAAPLARPLDLDLFAGERQGNVETAGGGLGDAVPGMAERGDRDRFRHGARRSGTRDFPRPRGSARR